MDYRARLFWELLVVVAATGKGLLDIGRCGRHVVDSLFLVPELRWRIGSGGPSGRYFHGRGVCFIRYRRFGADAGGCRAGGGLGEWFFRPSGPADEAASTACALVPDRCLPAGC